MHEISCRLNEIFVLARWHHAGKRFLHYCPFVREIHRASMESPPKRPVTWSFDFFSLLLICTRCWINIRVASDFRRHCYVWHVGYCPACRTTLVATRFRVAVICPIIQVPHCIRVFFYFVWFVFINHIFQFYYELCTYCNILDIYLS